jgi:hypothetical protein
MKTFILALFLSSLAWCSCFAETPVPTFKKIQLTDKFYCEGSYFADFNKDGRMDVVAGPFWYEGPDFTKKREIYPPKAFDPKEYSDVFGTFAGDFNGDGWPDVFHLPFPGTDGYWYENPRGKEEPWKKHLALKDVGNESPMWADVNADGRPDLIYNETGRLGFATFDPAKPDEPWTFHAITPKRDAYQRYTHGIGYGDIDGDGRIDLIESAGWWQQPAKPKADEPWTWHAFKFAEAGAHLLIYDADGDGLNDVITTWNCHDYGLLWHQQVHNEKGEISWQRHDILPQKPDTSSTDLRISQLHALTLADIDGDGIQDLVTGKRFWAHGPSGDVEPNAAAVLYWFELKREKDHAVRVIPHKIDDDSGVGTQVSAADLNADGIPDIIVGNKKGTFLFLSEIKKK